MTLELIREVEAASRDQAAENQAAGSSPCHQDSRPLSRIRGIGENFAAVLTREVFYPVHSTNRRQLASYVGLAPMPHQSGDMDPETPAKHRARGQCAGAQNAAFQLAWGLWWCVTRLRERTLRLAPPARREATGRTRRIAIVAMARQAADRAVALYRDRADPGRRRDPGRKSPRHSDHYCHRQDNHRR